MMKLLLGTIFSFFAAVAGQWLSPMTIWAQERQDKTYPLDAGMYYTIKKGDTLWDLSHHFFDSPWVWPDLWEKNQQIPNPHWIYPGNRIRIYNREGLERMGMSGVAPEAPSAALSEKRRKPFYFYYPAIDSVGFVIKTPLTPCGTVTKVITVKELISNLDMVYVQPAKNAAAFTCGDRFTIYRTLGTVRDPLTDASVGVQHYIVGVLEITEIAQPYCTAEVIKSFRHIEDNDLLTPYKARSSKIAISDSLRSFDGRIVGVQEARDLVADQDIVFIDKGQKDGIKIGQYYSVYDQPEVLDKREQTKALLPPIDLGTILVLHVEETTATALVTAAKKSIDMGKNLRTPPSLLNPVTGH